MEKQVSLTSEEIAEIIQTATDKSADRACEKMIAMFGLQDDDDGRKILRSMGDSARRASDFWEEMGCQARRGVVKMVLTAVWIIFLAGIGYLAYRAGITDKFVK